MNTEFDNLEINLASKNEICKYISKINKGKGFIIDFRNESQIKKEPFIEGSVSIPYTFVFDLKDDTNGVETEINRFLSNLNNIGCECPDLKKKYIITICSVGARAQIGKNILDSLGFKRVINGGGIKSLKKIIPTCE